MNSYFVFMAGGFTLALYGLGMCIGYNPDLGAEVYYNIIADNACQTRFYMSDAQIQEVDTSYYLCVESSSDDTSTQLDTYFDYRKVLYK